MAECDSTTIGSKTKTCSCCRIEKPVSEYYKDKKTKDGLYSRCKTCHNVTTVKWASNNKPSVAKAARERRKKDPEKHRKYGREYQSIAYKRNPEKFKARSKTNRRKDPEKTNASSSASRAKVPEKTVEYQSAYYEQHKSRIKENVKQRSTRMRDELKPKKCARQMRRNAKKKQALPAWANVAAIQIIYERSAFLTKSTGVPHNVDHIVPLQGKTVSGLHVENNLQILTQCENQTKGNRWWPDKP